MKLRKLSFNQKGDTIISVALSVIVLMAVMGLTFILFSRTFRMTQQSKERAQATTLVEAQIETLKAKAIRDDILFNIPPGDQKKWFCLVISDNNETIEIRYPEYERTSDFIGGSNNMINGDYDGDGDSIPDDFTQACKMDLLDLEPTEMELGVRLDTTPHSRLTTDFIIQAKWDSLNGQVDTIDNTIGLQNIHLIPRTG